MYRTLALATLLFSLGEASLQASALIEKTGRYDINWSTGVIRFYGTSLLNAEAEDAWRPAEQRAWSDGMGYLQKTVNAALGKSNRDLGLKPLGKSLSLLSSVNTTYYGDSRIKVVLEAQVDQVYRQIAQEVKGAKWDQAGGLGMVAIKLSKKMNPTVAFTVIDENKNILVDAKDAAFGVVHGAASNRWYKAELPKGNASPAKTIKASPVDTDTIQVARSDWTAELRSAIANGGAVVIVP